MFPDLRDETRVLVRMSINTSALPCLVEKTCGLYGVGEAVYYKAGSQPETAAGAGTVRSGLRSV